MEGIMAHVPFIILVWRVASVGAGICRVFGRIGPFELIFAVLVKGQDNGFGQVCRVACDGYKGEQASKDGRLHSAERLVVCSCKVL